MNYNMPQVLPQMPARTLSISLLRRSSLAALDKSQHNSMSSLQKIYSSGLPQAASERLRYSKSKRYIDKNQGVRINIRQGKPNRSQTNRIGLNVKVKPKDFYPKLEKKILVIDLNESLVQVRTSSEFDIIIPGTPFLYLAVRPYALELLQYVSETFDTYLFTASTRVYADRILKALDPEDKYFRGKLYREHCLKTSKGYIKDLAIFKGKDIKDIILVDCQQVSFENQPLNGVQIQSWNGDKSDCELKKLMSFLRTVEKSDDVRVNIRALRMDF